MLTTLVRGGLLRASIHASRCAKPAALLATVAFIGLLAGPAGARRPSRALRWRACGDLECATARLPRDYAHPRGATIAVAVVRFPARNSRTHLGSLFFNPGGPGQSGIEFLRRLVEQLHGDVGALGLERFDLVGFDPRGVGESVPAVDCRVNQETQGPLAQPFKRPGDDRTRALVARDRRYIRRCIQRNASILPYLSTANVARDVDRIRAALGDRKLSYFGGSYGTFLGATYESMFGRHVRAMVLDGALDPDQYINHPLSQWDESTAAFERELGRFLQACAGDQVACHGFGGQDPWAELDRLLGQLDRAPIPAHGEHPRAVDGDDARVAIHSAVSNKQLGWGPLATALEQADHGDGTMLRQLADGFYGWQRGGEYHPAEDRRFAIDAVERRFPRDMAAYWREGRRSFRDYPHFWWWGGYSKLVEGLYPIRPRGVFRGPFRNPASGPTTLVIGTTYDPLTPYGQAKRMVIELGNARLLTLNGDQHTAWASGNPCINSTVAAYLSHLTLPPRGKVCQQHVPFGAQRAAQDPAKWAPVAVVYRVAGVGGYQLHNGAWLGYSKSPAGVKIAHVAKWKGKGVTRETLLFCYAGVKSHKCRGRYVKLLKYTIPHGPAIAFKSPSHDAGAPHNGAFLSWNGSTSYPKGGIWQQKGKLSFVHYVPRTAGSTGHFHMEEISITAKWSLKQLRQMGSSW